MKNKVWVEFEIYRQHTTTGGSLLNSQFFTMVVSPEQLIHILRNQPEIAEVIHGEEPKKRKPVSIACYEGGNFDEVRDRVACDDGTVWGRSNYAPSWERLPDIPQDEE